MEGNIYAFDAYLVRPWRECCTRTELEVSQQFIEANYYVMSLAGIERLQRSDEEQSEGSTKTRRR